MKVLKLITKNFIIAIIAYGIIISLFHFVLGTHPSPYVNYDRLDTGDEEYNEILMWDEPNIVFSAKDYIKQSADYLWDKSGIQLYFVSLHIPEDVSTPEDMEAVLWEEINGNEDLNKDNALYICYASYKEDDTRDDFFMYNHILMGESTKNYADYFFMKTYEYYYKNYLGRMDSGEVWYTIPDCCALALKETVEHYQGVNIISVVVSGIILLLYIISIPISIKLQWIKDINKKFEFIEGINERCGTSLYLVETKDKREYQ